MLNTQNKQQLESLLIKVWEQKKEVCKDSYYEFFKFFWSTVSGEKLVENWHIRYLCDEMQIVGNWVINRQPKEYDLIVNISPGESKSTICTILFPVWLWVNDPSLRIITGAHSNKLSISHATKSRDCISSVQFQSLYGEIVKIRKDIDNKNLYQTTKKGQRIITSVGANILGEHANCVIIDDPVDPKGVNGDTIFINAEYWINKRLTTRKVDKKNTPTILIMQRLNEKDPSGDWLGKKKEGKKRVKHICLPAQNRDYEVHPRELSAIYDMNDNLMNPSRTDWSVLEEMEGDLGETGFAGQFGQAPRSFKGNILKKHHLQIIKLRDLNLDFSTLEVNFAVDTAYTKNHKEGDPSACLAFFEHKGRLYFLDYMRVWLEYPQLLHGLKQFVRMKRGKMNYGTYVEPKANGKSVVQSLKDEPDINAMEYDMLEGDKKARLIAVLKHFEAEKVFLIEGEWNEQFINECLTFPNAAHDEAIDVAVMAADLTFNRTTYNSEGWQTHSRI